MGVQTRLSDISANERRFKQMVPVYQEALRISGHDHKLVFTPRDEEKIKKPKNKPRIRSVCWYNPPFNRMVKKQIGVEFKKALEQHIPKDHPHIK